MALRVLSQQSQRLAKPPTSGVCGLEEWLSIYQCCHFFAIGSSSTGLLSSPHQPHNACRFHPSPSIPPPLPCQRAPSVGDDAIAGHPFQPRPFTTPSPFVTPSPFAPPSPSHLPRGLLPCGAGRWQPNSRPIPLQHALPMLLEDRSCTLGLSMTIIIACCDC